MNKTQLEYFIEVYRRKSYKKASEYLMITQQGVNKTIKSLEDEYRMIENTTNQRQKKVTIYAIDSVIAYSQNVPVGKRIIFAKSMYICYPFFKGQLSDMQNAINEADTVIIGAGTDLNFTIYNYHK